VGIEIIRPKEYHLIETCVAVEQAAWDLAPTDYEITPPHLLIAIQRSSGDVLLARDGDQTVGFCYGFICTTPAYLLQSCRSPNFYLSHQLGVLPAYQDRQVGYALKHRQRELVLARGIRLITWTFDPMQSKNAFFNIRKLGAICRCYKRDSYGQLSGINAGLPSDRFEVEWWLGDRCVIDRMQNAHPVENPLRLPGRDAWLKAGAVLLNPSLPGPGGLRVPGTTAGEIPPQAHALLIEIPASVQALKTQDLWAAQQWQQAVRALCETAFEQGFSVSDYLWEADQRGYYLLLKKAAPPTNNLRPG